MALFTLRYPSRCHWCRVRIRAGSPARWHHALGHSCANTRACDERRSELLDKSDEIVQNGEPSKAELGGSNG